MTPGPGQRLDVPVRIELSGLRILATHGVLAEEQVRPQPFEIDVVLDADVDRAADTDHLDDTVDYGAVCDVIAAVVGGERHQLLERVATRAADAVLRLDRRVVTVEITIRKLRPPVPHDLASSGVRVRRTRT